MISRKPLFIRAVFVLAALIARAATGAAQKTETGFLNRSVTMGTSEYRYVVYVPREFSRSKTYPVILALHGGGEYGSDGLKQTNYALAYAGLADAYALLATFGLMPPSEGMTKAREFARQALSLDESLAEAHATLGVTLLSYGYDFAGAEREYRRAIELDPNYLTAHQWYGELLTCLGRFDEASAEYRRALEIDPLSLPANWEYARFFYYARRFDEAIAQHIKVRELDAGFQGTYRTLAQVYRAKGDFAKAIEEQAGFLELSGEPQNAALIRDTFAKGGWKGFLRLVTAENSPLKFRHAIVARAYLELGEKNKAFDELNKAYEMRESPMQFLKVEPQLDPLRDDPRFQELLKKVGFPQ